MNGRAPAYRRCNEVTLVKNIEGKLEFKTFWKNVHQQFFISTGIIYGLTYEVLNKELVKDVGEGNMCYVKCRKDGWVKWEDFCKENNAMCLYYDFGRIIF